MTTLINRLRKAQGGFTLIELLVVVAIIALLATFAVPKLFEAINKSKGSVGSADMVTLTDAMERYYFDESAYPHAAATNTPDAIKSALVADKGFLKAGTSFTNGFKKGYVYLTDVNGSFYIMVDPGNQTSQFTVECGTAAPVWTSGATPLAATSAFQHIMTASAPSSTQMAAGCVLKAATGSTFKPADASIRTN